jgi:carboxyl-terminal processing protease
MKKKFIYWIIVLCFPFALFSSPSYALNCQQVRQLVAVYLKMHYSFSNFDDELSSRTLDNFIKAWDSGKVYFLKSDVDQFKSKYDTQLDDLIMAANCKVLDEIMNLYSKRFAEKQPIIKKLIDAKHDFTVEEFLNIDRKKMPYAKTTEEINDRWRKRVKFQLKQLKTTEKDLEKARKKLHKRYEIFTKRHNELTSDDVYAAFLNAFSSGLDPHSEYYTPEQLEDFRISTRLSLEGIGAVLRSEDGFTTIQSLVEGGAAKKTGKVKVGDKIIAVAQGSEPSVDVIDMDLREVVKLIRGPGGTEVQLTIVREDKGKAVQLVVPIIREKIQLEDRAAKSYVFKVNAHETKGQPPKQLNIGVIDLPSFYMDFEGRHNRTSGFKSSSEDVKREIDLLKKQGIDALVIDLRSNGGGSLDESINIAGLFFDKGPVVQIRAMDGSYHVQKDDDGKTYYNGPMSVLINRHSASASEIFAGAIQDYKRGLIIGDTHTFGKGTVQNLNDIDEKLGAIKVTISKFYRASGASTQLRGVESDVVIPDLLDQYEVGEKFYDYALPWEKIKSAKYQTFGLVDPYVGKLKSISAERVAKDDEFKEMRDEIKKYKESEHERSRVSLKEEKDEPKLAEEEEKDENATHTLKLDGDPILQEALRVTVDYVRLLNKQSPVRLTLPELKKNDKSLVKTKKEPTKKSKK